MAFPLTTSATVTNLTTTAEALAREKRCEDCVGLLLPIFAGECQWNQGLRAVLYLMGLLWAFFGIAELADAFMCSIDRITSMARTVHKYEDAANVQGASNQESQIYVGTKVIKFWNETVANLTLMALGSSAPEILLSIIETVGNGFRAGELGAGTIVGSAAFNLFCITAACNGALRSPLTRKIKRRGVFWLTAFTSILAYVWLFIVLSVISPGVVEIWEALVTLAMFPILVVLAYILDIKARNKYQKREKYNYEDDETIDDDRLQQFMRNIRRHHPELNDEQVLRMAKHEFVKSQHNNRGWYRINASRMIMGGGLLKPRLDTKTDRAIREARRRKEQGEFGSAATEDGVEEMELEDGPPVITFEKQRSFVLEREGQVTVVVKRKGNKEPVVNVGVRTREGTAKVNEDYIHLEEQLTFLSGETEKKVRIEIVNDETAEPDEMFFLRIDAPGISDNYELGAFTRHEITIIDEDGPGKVGFVKTAYEISDAADVFRVPIRRDNGLSGDITIEYNTVPLTARVGVDFEEASGSLTFKHGEMEQMLPVRILNTTGEKKVYLSLELNASDEALLTRERKCLVSIVDDQALTAKDANLEDRLKDVVRNMGFDNRWMEKFRKALNVNGGDLDTATAGDYVLHVVTFGWKMIGAMVPPVQLCNGWLAFCVSLVFVGTLTAIVGDLASIFGCLVGLKDAVTAITLVALGTSLPDTVASMIATKEEDSADAAIGNVTGSNSVNVFMGLGVPWVIASIYWAAQGQVFCVPAGSIGFSVLMYSICAALTLLLLFLKRQYEFFAKAELGGKTGVKIFAAIFLVVLWFVYVAMSTLQTYGIIKDPFAQALNPKCEK